VTVRPAQPDDADALVALFSAVAGEGRWIGGELPLSDAQAARLRASAARPVDDPEQLTVLADDDSDVVGWLTVYRVAPGRAGLGMALAASHRGRGIGRRLLDRAAGWAREREMHKLELEVWPHNERARRMYEAAGFVTEGHRHRHWRRADGSLWDAIDMGLVLDTWSPGMPNE
jgi:putative acetyltransferase